MLLVGVSWIEHLMQRCVIQVASELTNPPLMQISKVLPKVSRPQVYIEPSLTQLAAMAREDEQSLASVANFKVGHRQYGSVRWQEPVDVRGVDLDTAVLFSKGSVEVHMAFPQLNLHCRGYQMKTNTGRLMAACGGGLQAMRLSVNNPAYPTLPACSLGAVVLSTGFHLQVYFDDNKKPEIGQGLNKPAEVTLLAVYKTDKATGRPTTDPAAVEKFVKRLKSTAASQNARFVGYKAVGGVWQFQVDHFSK